LYIEKSSHAPYAADAIKSLLQALPLLSDKTHTRCIDRMFFIFSCINIFVMTTYQQAYRESIDSPETFWAQQAEALPWYQFPSTILSQDDNGFYRWYKGGSLNTCYLALDHHIEQGRAEQVALIYDSPVTNTKRHYTYLELRDEVARVAGGLQRLGVEKGDRVIIYMPMIPEAVFAMLACARIGAIHSVVFGGFAARELAIRIDDAQPKVVLTASGGIEINRIIHYMPLVDDALAQAMHPIDRCVVFQRPGMEAVLDGSVYLDWNEWLADAPMADCVPVDATDPLYILYTSGTTGKPKGIVRDNGGHAVALRYSMQAIYDTQPGEVFWAASDVGWVVGHSYIVYGPLISGCTTLLYEGKPVKTPDPGAFWRVIAEHGVKTLFTAPTAIRAIKKEDPDGLLLQAYDLSRFRRLYLAGERCDAATYEWAKSLLGERDVIDNWWQTESGWPMIAQMPLYGMIPVKPGAAGRPVCGFDIQILDGHNRPMGPLQEGAVCIKLPLPPSCLPTLWNNDDRFRAGYLAPYPGYYFSGDGGYRDEEGYVYITGRMDDVINVAGHRLSTADMEEVVAQHPAVAECAVIGIQDSMKGQAPVGFVVLKEGIAISDEQIERELIQMVRDKVGAVASFKRATIVNRLPKTRSGKILRRVMRAIADGQEYSMPSTIEDPVVLSEIEDRMKEGKIGEAFDA